MVASKDLALIFEFQCPVVTSKFIREPLRVSAFGQNCSFCKNILTFHVGDTKNAVNVFTIEKSQALPHSKYLQRFITNTYTAAIIYLPETDPDIFRVWLNWNKSHRIISPMSDMKSTNDDGFDQEVEYVHLIKAYILGVFLDDIKFKDAILDAMLAKSKTMMNDGCAYYPFSQSVNFVYKNTSRGSLLRQMVLDMYAEEGHSIWLEYTEEHYPYDSEFMADLALGLMRKRESLATDDEEAEEEDENMSDEEEGDENEDEEEETDPCRYHEHVRMDMPCYRTILKKHLWF